MKNNFKAVDVEKFYNKTFSAKMSGQAITALPEVENSYEAPKRKTYEFIPRRRGGVRAAALGGAVLVGGTAWYLYNRNGKVEAVIDEKIILYINQRR